ncbi:MAG: hypothetical protein AABO57_10455 [Acidobacteriota bacterium]
MLSFTVRTSITLLAGALSLACGTPPTVVSTNAPQAAAPQAAASSSQGELRLKAPDGWVSERPSSSMRVSQYQLPAAEGDAEAASLVVYYFGAGQGGSVNANLERWIGQMQPPDGRPSQDKAKTETTSVNGMKVTLLDVAGTYAGGDMGGGGTAQSKPNFRMRAAVIETPKGAYFIKLVGPEKTVARWDQAFHEFVRSAEFKG